MLSAFKNAISALRHNKANVAFADRDYDKAHKLFQKLFSGYGAEGATDSAPPESNLLFASLCYRRGEYEAAERAANITIDQLGSGRYRYNPSERAYMRTFARGLIVSATSKIGHADDAGPNEKSVSDSFNASEVHWQIKRNFPIKGVDANAPAWLK